MSQYQKEINNYINEIRKSRVDLETEHSGRTFLENLLKDLSIDKNIQITHESKRDTQGRGAPDFRFLSKEDFVIGYLENKKIGENLDKILKSPQIQKYRDLSENLIITDYLRWIWFYEGSIEADIRLCEKESLNSQKEISISEEKCKELKKMIDCFLSFSLSSITRAKDLAHYLSKPTRYMRDELTYHLQRDIQNKEEYSELIYLLENFQKTIAYSITEEDFGDAFAQTFSYSLFLTKISLKDFSQRLTIENIETLTPASFSLLKKILSFLSDLENYPSVKPAVQILLNIINATDALKIQEDLKFSQTKEKDPYLYFYEDFLHSYDPQKKVEAGVYYTPSPIVECIIRNLQEILITKFNFKEGLAHPQTKILDFACGTGTFLFEIYKTIFSQESSQGALKTSVIKNHILKNVYGFELLIPAYCVAHLKLSQFLKEEANYTLCENERIPVYLTNTLELKTQDNVKGMLGLIPVLAKEGKMAQSVKEDNKILVITGNPPYKGESKNQFKYIDDLIKPYFPNLNKTTLERVTGKKVEEARNFLRDEIKEKNSKWLNDDYVKFIRFAENKIHKAGKGIIGIITNHGFLDNPTFRAMRWHLMNTFEQIYIVDLHGNAKKKEKSPDGSLDNNVFDIQQGVCISFFIKKQGLPKGIFHKDLYGTRESKFNALQTLNILNSPFTKVDPIAPFYLFTPQNTQLWQEYIKGISLRDVFEEISVGIVTGKDEKVIAFTSTILESNVRINYTNFEKKYVKNINYRPFDTRKIYYNTEEKTIIERPRKKIMQHFIEKENIGLIFRRNIVRNSYDDVFISNKMSDLNSFGSHGSVIAPLYLYEVEKKDQKSLIKNKSPNFKKSFFTFIKETFGNISPEEILAYIYGVLHSTSYRKKYLEFLKVDFPCIPFNVDLEEFKRLSSLGQKLINAHLLKEDAIPSGLMGLPDFLKEQNFIVEKIRYEEKEQRLFYNQSGYFGNVSKEVWDFKIGGYQVLDKFLKSRKGIDISEDLAHLQKVIKILDVTIKIMKEIG